MIDIVNELNAIHRELGNRPAADGEAGVSVRLRRSYHTEVEDVWAAVTDPDRLKRWFLPVSGDLRVGGKFQLEGNAGGEILHCEPPRLLKVTFGSETSVVELRLSAGGLSAGGVSADGGAGTVLELEHTVPLEMAGSGAGALYVGPGWDGGLLGLSLFLQGEVTDDPVAAANSTEVVEFSAQSVQAWRATVEASGTATADEIAEVTEVAMAQFGGGALADALRRTDAAGPS
ncbi:MAG TPA: SRPBCC domain-containing protein [Pseudonocardiaceae bacterium]|nr:SRPBCC domain-containing protein [Pseudonocardiaceae bacterium]